MQQAPNRPLQKKRELALARSAVIQKDIPFRINRPKKMAVSDRPNICAVLCSLVLNTCAVARSLVFVMTSIPTSQFCHQHGNARGGEAITPAYGGSGQPSNGSPNYT